MNKNLTSGEKMKTLSKTAKLANYHLFCIKIAMIDIVLFAILTTYYIVTNIIEIKNVAALNIINLILGIISIAIGAISLVLFIILTIKQIINKSEEKKEINYIINSLFLIVLGILFIVM